MSGTDFQSRWFYKFGSYFGDTFLFQTHSNERENANVKIKDTVMVKHKMNIFMDESITETHNGKEVEAVDL